MKTMHSCLPAMLLIFAAPAILTADTVTIDFEGLSDGTTLTNQYASITFSNAIVLTAGVSLNEFEFPPHSGTNVASDNNGPMSLGFLSPVQSFSGYFTYAEPLTLDVFDAGNTLLTSLLSPFSNSEALSGVSGSSPNELLSVSSHLGISRITITGDSAGASFTLDDTTITPAQTSATPEPSTLVLLVSGFLFGLKSRKFRQMCHQQMRHQRVHPALLLMVAGLLAVGFPVIGAPTLGATFATPRTIVVRTPTIITVSVSIPDVSVINSGVNLVRLNFSGAPTILGELHDDGKNGDAVAGDRIYTIRVSVNEPTIGQMQLQVSAAFRGTLLRVQSNLPPIFIQPPNAPAVMISALSAQISIGNIAGAVQNFSDTEKADAVLAGLDGARRAALSAAFSNAQLIRASGDLRIYMAPWTLPNEQSTNLEFTVAPDNMGKWVIVSW